MSSQKRFNLALLCRVTACMFCVAMVLGSGHPPVIAQQMAMSSEDAVQDTNIAAINKHLEHTDQQVEHADERMQLLDSKISEMQGEERVAFVVLSLLTGGSVMFQRKKGAPGNDVQSR